MSLLLRLKRFVADVFGDRRSHAETFADEQARHQHDAPKNVVENLEKLS